MTEHEVTLCAVAIPAIASCVSAWIGARNRRDIRQINKAVNNRPPGSATIGEQVQELHEVAIPHMKSPDSDAD